MYNPINQLPNKLLNLSPKAAGLSGQVQRMINKAGAQVAEDAPYAEGSLDQYKFHYMSS